MMQAKPVMVLLLLSIRSAWCADRITGRNLGLNLTAETVTCEPVYDFLPCATELWGQLFLIVVYEVLLSLGDKYVSAGSELFFNMTGPGIFGASLFHVLGSIQVTVLMIVSGLSSSTETAEEQATMSMGLLSGSAVMFVTLIWGSCIALGSNDLSKSLPSLQSESEKPSSFKDFGVRTDVETSYTARIMILSMVPFVILQLSMILNSSTGKRVAILVSLIVTLAFLCAYCFYQIFQPWIQNRRFEYLMEKYVKDKLLSVLSSNGKPNIKFMQELFHEIDKDKNGSISQAELRVFILGTQLEEIGLHSSKFAKTIMEAFDSSGDALINKAEFVNGLLKHVFDPQQSVNTTQDHHHFKFLGSNAKNNGEERQRLLDHRNELPAGQNADKSPLNYIKAASLLLLGTAITVVLAKPLIVTVGNFATAAGISSFYVAYILIPVALNYRQALSAIATSRHKTQKAISLTLSEIYGAVFMSNMMGLAMFLALVYIRNLSSDVSAEVLVVLVICLAVGIFTSLRTTFPLWTSFVAFLLYPISLLLHYFLTSLFGWS